MNAEILTTARFVIEVTAYYALLSLSLIVPLLVAVAFFTLAERKIMASIQRRRGPNVVGFAGLGQPFADGLKALVKEALAPYQANRIIFIMAPGISFVLSLVNWALIPFTYEEVLADLSYGLLYIYAISSLSVYGIILAGWVSNSKYPFLGALRSAAQMVSYEVSIGLVFCIIALCAHSLNLTDVVFAQEISGWYGVLMWPIAAIFFVTIIAETNRAPFDLPEAEAEIVAGYNLEYSSIIFAMFFLGEYSNIFLMSTLFAVLFMGGWLPVLGLTFIPASLWLQLKAVFMCFMFVLVRATFPRYRYDQLMSLCWQVFLPFNFIYLLIIALIFGLA